HRRPRLRPNRQRVTTTLIRQTRLSRNHAPARYWITAQALGYRDKTATRLVTEAGGTWSRSAPGDHTR
ncbi:hypothetical protein ACIF6J_28930, partial [Streptomyces diastaticus]